MVYITVYYLYYYYHVTCSDDLKPGSVGPEL